MTSLILSKYCLLSLVVHAVTIFSRCTWGLKVAKDLVRDGAAEDTRRAAELASMTAGKSGGWVCGITLSL
jgi:hypothetical protein